MNKQGDLHLHKNDTARLSAIADEFTSHKGRSVILSTDAQERRQLTQMIRADLQRGGQLPKEQRRLPVLTRQELSNPRIAANYSLGEEIHYRKGSPEKHGIADHSVAVVNHIDRATNLLTVEKADGESVTYNPALLKTQTGQSTFYRAEKRDLAEGDRITFTKADFHSKIRKDGLGTVEEIGEDGSLRPARPSHNGRSHTRTGQTH